MTEKRFTIEVDEENIAHILDNSTDIGQYNLCTLLNELNNENNQLKSICQDHCDHTIDFKADCVRLEKENLDLSEELDYYKTKCASLETGMFNLKREYDKLKKENHGIQNKVVRLLDYVEIKQCVTRTEIKKWWNGDVE